MTWRKPHHSRQRSLKPAQVKYLEGVSWTGELPPISHGFNEWLDQNTHSLKLAAKHGDMESVDELLELLKYPCIQPPHPENAGITANVCETVASKIRSVAPYAATDDIADRLNYESQNLESNLATYWREHHKFNFNDALEISNRLYSGTLPAGSTVAGENINLGYYRPGDPRNHQLPENLHVLGNLHLYNYPYKFLPIDLSVDGYLELYDSELVALPSGLKLGGGLSLDNSKKLKSLPSDLVVPGSLSLFGCTNLETIPDTIKVGGGIFLPDTTSSYADTEDPEGMAAALAHFHEWRESKDKDLWRPGTRPVIPSASDVLNRFSKEHPQEKYIVYHQVVDDIRSGAPAEIRAIGPGDSVFKIEVAGNPGMAPGEIEIYRGDTKLTTLPLSDSQWFHYRRIGKISGFPFTVDIESNATANDVEGP